MMNERIIRRLEIESMVSIGRSDVFMMDEKGNYLDFSLKADAFDCWIRFDKDGYAYYHDGNSGPFNKWANKSNIEVHEVYMYALMSGKKTKKGKSLIPKIVAG